MKKEPSTNQELKDEQAIKMAKVFQKINIKDLSEFLSAILLGVHRLDEENKSLAISFVAEVNFTIISHSYNETSQKMILETLQKVLPEFFNNLHQNETRKEIKAAGMSLLLEFSELYSDEETVLSRMNILSAFMQISELYDDYYFYDKEIWKEKNAA